MRTKFAFSEAKRFKSRHLNQDKVKKEIVFVIFNGM